MSNLTFIVDGEKVLSRKIRIISDGVKSMTNEFKQIGELVKRSAEKNIESGGSESGGKWKPLSPKTVRMRQKRQGYYRAAPNGAWPRTPVLQWTGNMKKGFRSAPWSMQVVIDNPTRYFKYHQSQLRDSAKLPRRLMLELKQTDKVSAMSIIAAGLNKRLKGGNFGRQF